MKVYVDELPKSCDKCPCFYDESISCQASEKWLDLSIEDNFNRSKERHKDCPLQSISYYTKQVRKEVCDEIKAEFDTSNTNHIDEKLYPPTQEAILIGKGFKACKERLFEKLDKIEQGETNA